MALFDTTPKIKYDELAAPDLLEKFKKVKQGDKDIIEKFYALRVNELGVRGCYPYSLNYMYNEMNGNHAHRYAIIEKDGDEIFVAIKKVDMFNIKYNRLIGLPISKQGDRYIEKVITAQLMNNGFISEVYIREDYLEDVFVADAYDTTIADEDFYTHIPTKFKEIDRSKFRSKHRINKCNRNELVEFRALTPHDITSVKMLHADWKKLKADESSLHGGRLFNNFIKNFNGYTVDENMLIYGLFYDDILLAFTVLAKTNDGYCYQLINQSYNRKNEPYDMGRLDNNQVGDLTKILTDIGQIFYYYYIKELNNKEFIGVTAAGTAGSKKLLTYKRNMNSNSIKYYKVKEIKNES